MFTRREALEHLALGLGAPWAIRPSAAGAIGEGQGNPMRFQVYRDKGRKFRWRLKAGNGQVMATAGESYSSKAACLNGIERIQQGAAGAEIDDQT